MTEETMNVSMAERAQYGIDSYTQEERALRRDEPLIVADGFAADERKRKILEDVKRRALGPEGRARLLEEYGPVLAELDARIAAPAAITARLAWLAAEIRRLQ